MCGRFDFHGDLVDVEAVFGPIGEILGLPPPCYNVAPTMPAPCLTRAEGKRVARTLTFGCRRQRGGMWVNVRAETLGRTPRGIQPCVVLAQGYYEWQRQGSVKQPYYFTVPSQKVLALAAVRRGDACLVITCDAQGPAQHIHDRMPALVGPDALDSWLGEGDTAVLGTQAARRCHPVARGVNDARVDGPQCIAPLVSQ